MEIITSLFDFILHVDRYLETFVLNYGLWVYALLFLVIFIETGVVVMPFLPGDSLLFVVGAMCGVGLMSYPLSIALLLGAAVLGNQSNYALGRYFGPRVFKWEDSRFFNKKAFNSAHDFYERYGGITIIIARFVPIIRTFAPIVAGIGDMKYRTFLAFNVIGAALWTILLVSLGFGFGSQVTLSESSSHAFFSNFLSLRHQRFDHFVFGHHSNNLALNEEVPALLTRRDPEIRVPCFAGAINDTAHHRDLNRNL